MSAAVWDLDGGWRSSYSFLIGLPDDLPVSKPAVFQGNRNTTFLRIYKVQVVFEYKALASSFKTPVFICVNISCSGRNMFFQRLVLNIFELCCPCFFECSHSFFHFFLSQLLSFFFNLITRLLTHLLTQYPPPHPHHFSPDQPQHHLLAFSSCLPQNQPFPLI